MAQPPESSVWHARWLALRRHRSIVFWTAIGTLAVAEAFVLGLPSLYRASATLLVEGGPSSTLVESSTPDAVNARLQTIKEEALSRTRLVDLIRHFGLYGATPDGPVTEAMLTRFQRDVRVDVTSDQNSNGGSTAIAFTLSYVGRDPRTAADVTNALSSFYVAQNEHMRDEQASRATEYIGAQIADTKKHLDAEESRVSSYTAENSGGLPQQVDANLTEITRLDAQLRLDGDERLKLVERRQTLQNQLAEIETRTPPPDDNTPAAQLARQQKDLADLRAKFPETYPDVKVAEAQVAALERQVRQAAPATALAPSTERTTAEQALKETDAQIAQIEQQDTTLRNQISGYERRVESAPARQPVFDGLMRDYQATRDRYDALLKRYDDAQLASRAAADNQTEEFRVLDAALPPAGATGPARRVLLAAGAALALVVGLLAAFATDGFDTSFHTVDDLRSFTSVPVLVSIPAIVTQRGTFGRRMKWAAVACVQLLVVSALAVGAFHLAHASEPIVRVLSRVS